MLKASFFKHRLKFKTPGGTSRGVLKTKETWFILIYENEQWGIGECAMFPGLSADDRPDYETMLKWTCDHIQLPKEELLIALTEFPSIQFGIEVAFRSLSAKDPFILFPSNYTKNKEGIPINGLVWMGSMQFMKDQITKKLSDGFTCIKMKIGAIDFEEEVELLKSIRKEFNEEEVELRVDANGAFSFSNAMEKLKILSDLGLHSIEQPIKKGHWDNMAVLCERSPLPIALDEELIGVFTMDEKINLLKIIQPQFIILKPSLIGGYNGSDSWISLAEAEGIGWWITSALESNIGLNSISQYTFIKNSKLPQGLGTGGLFENNIKSPLHVCDAELRYYCDENWDLNFLSKIANQKF